MAGRRRKPQLGGTPEKVIPPLGWLFLGCSIFLYFMAFQLPWFGQFLLLISKFSLTLTLGCWGYWLFVHKEEVLNLKNKLSVNKKALNLDIVNTRTMKNFLFQAKAVAPDPYDPSYQQVPDVRSTKNGLKIEAIGNLRQWLVSDSFRDSLESFLNQKGYDLSIQNASYHSDGWVYYKIIRGIKSDRLRF